MRRFLRAVLVALSVPLVTGLPSASRADDSALYLWIAPEGDQPAHCEMILSEPAPDRPRLGSPVFSPDGNRLVMDASDDLKGSRLFLVDLTADNPDRAVRHLGPGYTPVFTPGDDGGIGPNVAYMRLNNDEAASTDGIYLIDASLDLPLDNVTLEPTVKQEEDELQPVTKLMDGAFPLFTPDGRHLLHHAEHNWRPDELFLLDLKDGDYLTLTMPPGTKFRSRPFIADNSSVVAVVYNGRSFTRVARMSWESEPTDGRIQMREQTIANWPRFEQLIDADRRRLHYISQGVIAADVSEVFVAIRLSDRDRSSQRDRQYVEVWRFPAKPWEQPHAILRTWPGITIRDMSVTADGKRLAFVSDLYGKSETLGSPLFANDLLVLPITRETESPEPTEEAKANAAETPEEPKMEEQPAPEAPPAADVSQALDRPATQTTNETEPAAPSGNGAAPEADKPETEAAPEAPAADDSQS